MTAPVLLVAALQQHLNPQGIHTLIHVAKRATSISSAMRRLSGEAEIQPDRLADDLGRGAVAGIGRLGG